MKRTPHVYVDDPDTPGTCRVCRRSDPHRTNEAHRLPDVPAQAEHRRRAGEQE